MYAAWFNTASDNESHCLDQRTTMHMQHALDIELCNHHGARRTLHFADSANLRGCRQVNVTCRLFVCARRTLCPAAKFLRRPSYSYGPYHLNPPRSTSGGIKMLTEPPLLVLLHSKMTPGKLPIASQLVVHESINFESSLVKGRRCQLRFTDSAVTALAVHDRMAWGYICLHFRKSGYPTSEKPEAGA